jgi:hypothetical protein
MPETLSERLEELEEEIEETTEDKLIEYTEMFAVAAIRAYPTAPMIQWQQLLPMVLNHCKMFVKRRMN